MSSSSATATAAAAGGDGAEMSRGHQDEEEGRSAATTATITTATTTTSRPPPPLVVSSDSPPPLPSASSSSPTFSCPETYTEQTVDTLPLYLATRAPRAMDALAATSFVDLDCTETGSGDRSLVFVVTNPLNDRSVLVKQALPYAKTTGEAWPLSIHRARYEYEAMVTQGSACPRNVPEIYHFCGVNGLLVMEYVGPPRCAKLRHSFMSGLKHTSAATDLGTFCANALFKTSGLHLSREGLDERLKFWSYNSEMCSLAEQVVFTEPYIRAANNRWTSPQLDAHKSEIETDTELKVAVARLKSMFSQSSSSLSSPSSRSPFSSSSRMSTTSRRSSNRWSLALLHADLHSGSVLCSSSPSDPNHPGGPRTFVVDPNFGFYGPMAFDTGAVLASMLLAYVSQPGHGNGEGYADWILDQACTFWNTFVEEFVRLWDGSEGETTTERLLAMDGFPPELFEEAEGEAEGQGEDVEEGEPAAAAAAARTTTRIQRTYTRALLRDTLGFAGAKMLRRIVGTAHAEDLESIEDVDVKARCEVHGLEIAKELIKGSHDEAAAGGRGRFGTFEEVVRMAKEKKPKRREEDSAAVVP